MASATSVLRKPVKSSSISTTQNTAPKLANLFPRFQNGAQVTSGPPTPSFDLSEAIKHLSTGDEKLKRLIAETAPFQMDQDHLQSPYEALLEAIV